MTTLRIAVWLARTANDVRLFTFHPMLPCLALALWMMFLPGLASAQSAEDQRSAPGTGSIQGAVKDSSGSTVAGAIVTLETAASTGQRTAIHRPSRGFPLFRRGVRKLQDHDRRLWIRGLDRGERGHRFER